MTTTTYAVDLTVDTAFSPYTIGKMIAEAMATMPDDTFDFSFDPYWDGEPQVTLALTYEAPGIERTTVGSLTITAPGAKTCPVCQHVDFEENARLHGRTHVENGYEIHA